MKKNSGLLTVEASIALTFFIFFILFFLSFGRIYRAQNVVGHATLQCAQALATESYLNDKMSQSDWKDAYNIIVGLGSLINPAAAGQPIGDVSKMPLNDFAKNYFALAIGEDQTKADDTLKKLGVTNGQNYGLDCVQLNATLTKDNDFIVQVTYQVELQFPLFGIKDLTLTKSAESHAFKPLS